MNQNIVHWIILVIAGIFEVSWAISMKLSNGFTDIKWSIITIILLIISMGLLAFTLKFLPVGTAYAVWTGIGAIGTATLGIILFKESAEFWRVFFISLILIGIIGLKFVTK